MANLIVLLAFIAIIILVIIAVLKFVKRLIHIVFSFAVVGLLLFLFFSIYSDLSDVNENFYTSQKIFLLELDNNIVAGFTSTADKPATPLNSLGRINQLFLTNDFDSILSNSYRLFIVKWDVFEDLKQVEFDNNVLQNTEIVNTLKSSELSSEIKGLLFATMFQEVDNPKFVKGLKDGAIIVHKETATFKLIKFLPKPIAEKVMSIMT